MRGYILNYDESSKTGVINSQDNQQRYKFSQQDWQEASLPAKGMQVDFVGDDLFNASQIYLTPNLANKATAGVSSLFNLGKESAKKNYTMLIYVMYLVGLLINGVFSFRMLSLGIFSVIGLVLAYWKVSDFAGSIYQSHLKSLIGVFWWSLFWSALDAVLMLTLVGIPVSLVLAIVVYIWMLYRLIKGFICLSNEQAIIY